MIKKFLHSLLIILLNFVSSINPSTIYLVEMQSQGARGYQIELVNNVIVDSLVGLFDSFCSLSFFVLFTNILVILSSNFLKGSSQA